MECSAPLAPKSSRSDLFELEDIPMTPGHQAIWLDQHTHTHSPLYNIGGGGFIEGPLDLVLFRKALSIIIAESDTLRLVPQSNAQFSLLKDITPDIEEFDFSEEKDPEAKTRALWAKIVSQPFVFDGYSPSWKIVITRLSENRHGLQTFYHHLLMDGYGTSLVMQRWSAVYSALSQNKPVPLLDTPRYCDFLIDNQAYCESERYEKDRQFWEKRLSELPPPIVQPRQETRVKGKLSSAIVQHHMLSRSLYDQLEEGVSSSAPVFLAALALYYSRTTGQNQIVIGVPTLNRGGKRYKSTLGLFMNVMPVPITVTPESSLSELIQSVSQTLRACYRHQRFPLSDISRRLGVIQQGRAAVFDLIFSFERQLFDVPFDKASLLGTHQIFPGAARFPLALSVCEFYPDDDVEIVLEADQNYLFEGEAQLLLKRWHFILETIAQTPEALCKDIKLIPPDERKILDNLSIPSPLPVSLLEYEPKTVVEAFMAQVKKNPEATALISAEETISYSDLELWSRRVASKLRDMGTGPDNIIAFAVERSPAMIASILGILRSGAAFMPMDPHAPEDRLRHMLEEGGVSIVIVDAVSLEYLEHLPCDFLQLENIPLKNSLNGQNKDKTGNDEKEKEVILPNHLAYVLYTSGSSGRPKGVMIEHRALMSRIISTYDTVPADRSCQGTQITFDPAMVEVFAPLCQGGAIILPPPGRQSMEVIARTILDYGASFAIFVPSTLPRFLDAVEGKEGLALRLVWCGGEILPPTLAQRFLDITGARLINCYGPTEATILASSWECLKEDIQSPLPVGKAIDDSTLFILDNHGCQVPFGVTGEIYLGGQGLARGYLNRPDQDTERFIQAAFNPNIRLYKTGDRGYLTSDGVLHFSGRVDRQVKVRGHRIEPDEIETVLLAHPSISGAAIKAKAHQGSHSLYAWIASKTISEQDVRHYLHSKLPDYMVPTFILVMEALPESASGKVDWNALPQITQGGETEGYVAPMSGLEMELVEMWQEILQRSPIGIHDNFFSLGGDSLSAMTFLSGLDALSGKETTLSLSFFIHHPTIAELAEAFLKFMGDKPIILPLSDHPTKPTFFLAASGHGDVVRFQRLADALGNRCSLVMLQPPLTTSEDSLECRTQTLAKSYADAIEAKAEGDIIIGGFSIGGVMAIETARELSLRNRAPRQTILLETVYPFQLFNSAKIWSVFVKIAKSMGILSLNINGRRLDTMFSDKGLTQQIEAMKVYRATPFDGPVDLVISDGLNWLKPVLFRPWKKCLLKPLRIRRVRGWHGSMFTSDNVEDLAEAINKSLNESVNKL